MKPETFGSFLYNLNVNRRQAQGVKHQQLVPLDPYSLKCKQKKTKVWRQIVGCLNQVMSCNHCERQLGPAFSLE